MAGMDHSNMPGMQHGSGQKGQQSMAGMDHSNMAGMQHGNAQPGQQQSMAGMDHSNMPGMPHGATGEAVATPPPTTNSAISRTRPASTLAPDALDMPAPIAISEAVKAAQNMGDGDARQIVPGRDDENPPTPQPATRDSQGSAGQPAMDHSQHSQGAATAPQASPPPAVDHSQHGTAVPAARPRQQSTARPAAARPAAQTVYTCPMHPEVTSAKPGTCTKCGTTLVKKSQ